MLLYLLVSMIWPTQAVFYLVSVDAMHLGISSPIGTETNPHSCREREGEALPATFPRDRICVLTLSGVVVKGKST
ncbi:hypothetical protein OIU78_026377 [Salix suchowensis]|nr:hypothetical protein OIU78_026377 [Salix suchowensis]